MNSHNAISLTATLAIVAFGLTPIALVLTHAHAVASTNGDLPIEALELAGDHGAASGPCGADDECDYRWDTDQFVISVPR